MVHLMYDPVGLLFLPQSFQTLELTAKEAQTHRLNWKPYPDNGRRG